MDKNELLSTLGFSKSFISKLDEFEDSNVVQFEQLSFENRTVEMRSCDSTNLHIKEKQSSTNKLYITT